MRGSFVVVLLAATGCKVSATFQCDESTQCGAGGTCEMNGLCSFPDPTCASGRRYGDYSGDLSGVCVGDEPATDGAIADAAPPDSSEIYDCANWTFEPSEFDPCLIPVPNGPVEVDLVAGAWTLDGDTGVLSDGSSSIPLAHATVADVAVVSVDHFASATGTTVRVTGSRPVAIAAWGIIQIGGTIDVSSALGAGGLGAGASSSSCSPAGVGSDGNGGDSGSGGGGFGAPGGRGGKGDNGSVDSGLGGAAIPTPAVVRGGCAGAPNVQNEPGGPGGGGIALISQSTLAIAGLVHAGGGGGSGATPSERGGAGGGSGGTIKLEARTISVSGSAILAANGGQGGGGSGNVMAANGADGRPDINAADIANASGQGGRGGRGGHRGSPAGGSGNDASEGGGGGGGSVGYILYRGHVSADIGGASSPDATSF